MSVHDSNIGHYDHSTRWAIGSTVRIDSEPQHVIVTAILIRSGGVQYEVSWIGNGDAKSAWVDAWRINPVEHVTAGF